MSLLVVPTMKLPVRRTLRQDTAYVNCNTRTSGQKTSRIALLARLNLSVCCRFLGCYEGVTVFLSYVECESTTSIQILGCSGGRDSGKIDTFSLNGSSTGRVSHRGARVRCWSWGFTLMLPLHALHFFTRRSTVLANVYIGNDEQNNIFLLIVI